MARKPRLEYAGAVYHVMNRGNRQQAIFRTDGDRLLFLSALEEVCGRTGWKIHAYALMGNHYHLLVETPEPNLTEGMQWLLGTYTKRFNAEYREWGHLFQGRYKAIPVDTDGGYFPAVATSIHLNPVRVKGYDFDGADLEDYAWSSYPGFVRREARATWLCADRALAALSQKQSRKVCLGLAVAAAYGGEGFMDQAPLADGQGHQLFGLAQEDGVVQGGRVGPRCL